MPKNFSHLENEMRKKGSRSFLIVLEGYFWLILFGLNFSGLPGGLLRVPGFHLGVSRPWAQKLLIIFGHLPKSGLFFLLVRRRIFWEAGIDTVVPRS